MYKVFFNNNTLFLANKSLQDQSFYATHKYFNLESLKDFIFNDCQQIENEEILIHHNSLSILWDSFTSLFKVKHAGGGLVINPNKQILFIKRRGMWDLPKGHQEKNENIETTAVREVSEECGIHDLEIVKPLILTHHTYWLNGRAILKPTHWYLMQHSANMQGIPQTEEDITEIKWFTNDEIKEVFANTFPSIIDVIHDYFADREA